MGCRVYFRHIRAAGLCAPGFRKWAIQLGYDRRQIMAFLKHGVPIETVESIDDGFAAQVAEYARAEYEAGVKVVTQGSADRG